MADAIQSKDLQMKKQREAHKMELANCINVSHLSAVSTCTILGPFIKRFISTFLSYLGTKRCD